MAYAQAHFQLFRRNSLVSLGFALFTGLIVSLLLRLPEPVLGKTNSWLDLKLQLTEPEAHLDILTGNAVSLAFRQPVLRLGDVTDLFSMEQVHPLTFQKNGPAGVIADNEMTVRVFFEQGKLKSLDLPPAINRIAITGQLFNLLRQSGQFRCDFDRRTAYSMHTKQGAERISSSIIAASKRTRSPCTSAPAAFNMSRASGNVKSMPISESTRSEAR